MNLSGFFPSCTMFTNDFFTTFIASSLVFSVPLPSLNTFLFMTTTVYWIQQQIEKCRLILHSKSTHFKLIYECFENWILRWLLDELLGQKISDRWPLTNSWQKVNVRILPVEIAVIFESWSLFTQKKKHELKITNWTEANVNLCGWAVTEFSWTDRSFIYE